MTHETVYADNVTRIITNTPVTPLLYGKKNSEKGFTSILRIAAWSVIIYTAIADDDRNKTGFLKYSGIFSVEKNINTKTDIAKAYGPQ